MFINSFSRCGTGRLFYVSNFGIIHRNKRRFSSLGIIRRYNSCLFKSGFWNFPALCYNNSMRTVYLLSVEPDIILFRIFKSKSVILKIVSSAKNFKSICGNIFLWCKLYRFLVIFSVIFKISLSNKLFSYCNNLVIGSRSC